MFNKTFLRKTPESFYPIDIDFARGKSLRMVNFKVPESAKHQRIVAFEFVRTDNGLSSNGFNGQIQQGFRADLPDVLHLTMPLHSKRPKKRYIYIVYTGTVSIGFNRFDSGGNDCRNDGSFSNIIE